MSVKKSAPLLLMAVGGVVLLTVSGCYDPYYVGGAVGYQTPYAGTAVSYRQPWYDYYYYPSADVYFNYRTGYYYHHDHGRWNHVRRLPRHIRVHDYDRVHLRARGDRPYLYHDEHRKKYKGNRKNYKHGYRDDRYRDERKHDRRYKREYKDERKHERSSRGSDKKRYKHESGRDDRDRSDDRHRRKKEEKQRKINDRQRKTVEKQQERERRRKAVDREIDAAETRVYGGRNSDRGNRNSGWYLQK